MLRKDRRNSGPPTGNWQTGGGCQGAAMVRQYTNSGGRGYRVCQKKRVGLVLLVSQYSTPAQDTITPLLLQSKGLSVGSFLWALFQVCLGLLPGVTKQGICGQPWERAVDEVARLAAPRVPMRVKPAWGGEPRTLKNDMGQLETRKTLLCLNSHNRLQSTPRVVDAHEDHPWIKRADFSLDQRE
ncbi:hypothetical protein Q8A73_003807 [Channa argus]|nr:hypothetical protein Q8A73_003807 [Channa argus]